MLFSFLHLHWYYIQSLFESSKPLSSDQGIVITGTFYITYRVGNSAFSLLPFGKYIKLLHPWILDFQHSPLLDASEKRSLPNSIRNFLRRKFRSIVAAPPPPTGAESEAETSVQSTQALCRSNSLGQDWGWEADGKNQKKLLRDKRESCRHWTYFMNFVEGFIRYPPGN